MTGKVTELNKRIKKGIRSEVYWTGESTASGSRRANCGDKTIWETSTN